MTDYVVGFLFNQSLDEVVLIRKNKPEWQKDLLNGVGGKVEPGESPYRAMVREFIEEAGPELVWEPVGTLGVDSHQGSCRVHFFAARGNVPVKSKEAEQVGWYLVNDVIVKGYGVIPNLRWLLPLARQKFDLPNWVEQGTFTLA